jgi:hypothetical protein
VSNALVHIGDVTANLPAVLAATEGNPRRRALPALITGGLSHPALRAFAVRVRRLIADAATIEPRADERQLLTPMMWFALKEPSLKDASDEELTAFLLYAASTGLALKHELIPVITIDPATRRVVVEPVETIEGLKRIYVQGGARSITTATVFERDTFRNRFDHGVREFTHDYPADFGPRGAAVAYYALIDLPRGAWVAKVLDRDEVQGYRRASVWRHSRAWRDYEHRMGELQALRAAALLVPNFAGPARYRAPHREVPLATSPLLGLGEDPYGAPVATRPGTPERVVEDADVRYVDAIDAEHPAPEDVVLPGSAKRWSGWGGTRLGRVPDEILQQALDWLEGDVARQTRYPRLKDAITHVLAVRRAAASGTRA